MAIKTRQTTATGVTNVDAPLTNAEVDNNFVELQQNKVSTSGDTMTGDLNFGDSDKAIFGAGSDLQIYHDGSNSYIKDAGTGTVIVQASDFELRNSNGTITNLKNDMSGLGGINLYYGGSQKLKTTSTGIDVTGNVVVSGTVDGVDIAALNTSALTTSTTFGGDVSGTYDAIVVANDSHNHQFNNLTNKTSGTGEYSTSGYLTAGRGTGGISLTHNDGYGNANITFNHKAGVPEQNGQSGRITLNTDNTVSNNAQMDFELGLGTSGTGISLPPVFSLFDDEVKTWQPLTVTGNITVSGTVDGVDIAGSIDQAVLTTSSPTFNNLYVSNAIYHADDTDTYFQFHNTSNQARIVCGGAEVMEWGPNYAKLSDNDYMYFGSGADFRIFHNGTNTYLKNYNHAAGNIYIQGEDTSGVGHTMAAFYSANAAPYTGLWYDGTEVFTTVSGGVNVDGTCTATSFSGDGSNLTNVAAATVQVSESVDDSADYNVLFSDTSGTGNVQMAPQQDDGGLTFNPSSNYLQTGNIQLLDRIRHGDDTDTYIQFHANDQWRVVTGGSERLEVTNTRTWVNRLFVNSGVVEDHEVLSGTTPTCNPSNAGYYSLTMTGNTTFTFGTPWTTIDSIGFVLELTGNGGTVTWPPSVDWAGGTAPEPPASGETDLLVFNTRDGGTTWYGMLAIDAAA